MSENELSMARRIAEAAAAEGGRAYFVGGFVRDRLMGRENKDIDIEVHRVSVETLTRILGELGEPLLMGASFGVMGLRHYELDVAMPRSETATGRGHRDFAVSVDPFLGEERAAQRRDFTINALMENVLTGEIVDGFGGLRDLREGVLRHVSDESFAEDPLRVLRCAQFAARFGFTVADETAALCGRMDLSSLAKERVMDELEKALLKAAAPSVFFETLRRMGQLSVWFPELERTVGIPQSPRFHAEGDVWTHTMLVTDAAAALRDGADKPLALLLAALTHDFGKAVCSQTVDGQIHNYGHETLGLPLAEAFLRRLTNEKALIETVLNLVENHMRPNILAADRASVKATNRMFDRSADPEALILLAVADRRGSLPLREADSAFLYERLGVYREYMSRPHVTGRDLIGAGVPPSERFSGYLDCAHKLRLAGVPKENALRQTLALARKQGDMKG